MKLLKSISALGLAFALTACGSVSGTASRDVSYSGTVTPVSAPATGGLSKAAQGQHLSVSVAGVGVLVPRTLKVNEGNSYYPIGDIVWRGDPIGDRYLQIEQIFRNALAQGTGDLQGEVPVLVDIQVLRFHSVTDRTRYSVGGVHNMIFRMRVRDARTGATLVPTKIIEADLPAFGGAQAAQAEARGQTQKVRVTDYLAYRIRQELTNIPTPR